MKPRSLFWIMGLVTVLVIASCAPTPAASAVDTAPPVSAPTEASASQPTAMEVQAVATSRGPNLEASNPSIVSLASGQLQLVEFFRFT